jgi:CubicO group peptidase (beta-lactamase class C family)
MPHRTLTTVALALLCGGTLVAQSAPDSLSARVDSLFAPWNRPDAPGAAVLVIRDGTVLHRRGYGSANLEHQVPITPTSVFDIASVSKQFCGMAIAMLVEAGTISLDDEVRTYIPELPDFGSRLTIRHLVHHIGGVRDWPGALAVAGWQMDDVISFPQILRMAYHQRALNFEPGTRYLYSNTGYNLLAEVVARVTGLSFPAWTRQHIFEPLGMRDTRFHDDHTAVVPARVYGYGRGPGGSTSVNNGLTALGSSSLFTTLDDLGKWVRNFDDHTVGGRAVIERMRHRGVLNDGDTIAYAYGLSIDAYRGAVTASHGGSWAGFRTHLLHFPEHRFGVVVLGNFATFNPSRPAYQIADLYLDEVLRPAAAVQPAARASGDTVRVDRATLDAYPGLYQLGPGWFVTITRDGDRLDAQATNEAKFPMTARSATEFHVQAYGASMTFRRGAGGAVTHLDYRDITAMRVVPWNPTPADLRALVGRYDSDELGTTYGIELRDSTLVATHRRHGDIVLTPLARDEFRGGAWFAAGVQFVRDRTGAVSGLRISNGRALNLEFTKVGR